MNEPLAIQCDWLSKDSGSELERVFYAGIEISAGAECLTRLDDELARTVRTHIRADAYRLAVWFASNWWRLRWEPVIGVWETDVDWRMSHCISGSGGGYAWPRLSFASDGESIAIFSVPSDRTNALQTVRFLSNAITHVSAQDFEMAIDAFIEAVQSRGASFDRTDSELDSLWNEVRCERRSVVLTRHRKLEAMCGFDPDESPPNLVARLINVEPLFGVTAIDEIAAAERSTAGEYLEQIGRLSLQDAIQAELPTLGVQASAMAGERPWQSARRLAKSIRSQLDLKDRPVSDEVLAEIMKASPRVLGENCRSKAPYNLALRNGEGSRLSLYLSSRWRTGRRYALARLIGGSLANASNEKLVPATNAKTARQQFQRAFAQEFLCPYDGLREQLAGRQLDSEEIQEVAEYYDVSPMVVRTTLVNKGELDRDAFSVV